ncbi:MAG TPA: neutral zinc metallopeptidase, partial [Pirellulaceae bacterium]|nr:neutral zinc metallopeptidase [Pirellulaceae bacterium]
MRWQGGRQSDNVEDRRGMGGGRGPVMVGGGLGTIAIVIIVLLLGGDPRAVLQNMQPGPAGGGAVNNGPAEIDPAQEELAKFVSVVLADTEDVWTGLFRQGGRTYQRPKLVLFSGAVNSACGQASASVGPFYCPADEKVYIDLSF